METRVIIEKSVVYLVAAFYLFVSLVKLFPTFQPEITADMVEKFKLYSPVCITVLFGYQPSPVLYMRTVGILELSGSLALLMRDLRQVGSCLLAVVMIGAVLAHVCVHDNKGAIFPFVLLLILCYIYRMTVKDKLAQKSKTD